MTDQRLPIEKYKTTASNSFIVIPARLDSSRLKQKLLLAETGQPLIQHTYQAASRATKPVGTCVATDSPKIAQVIQQIGGQAILTSPACNSGTDRVAEIARNMPQIDLFVNVQGDEPEIEAEQIDQVITLLEQNDQAVMSTLATPIRSRQALQDPGCVKVVFDNHFTAMYFSRSVIPHVRGQWDDALLESEPPLFYQHLGIYAYRRDYLLQLAAIPQTACEKLESLEQLRVLQSGEKIMVGVVDHAAQGIDTIDDYRAFVQRVGRAVA